MGLHDTTVKEEVSKHLKEARERIASLQDWLKHMDERLKKQIADDDGGAFTIQSATTIIGWALDVYNAISMVNGACLVRSKD